MSDFMVISGLVLVGTIWGVTNPFLERGVVRKEEEQSDYSWRGFLKTILNFKFVVPFGLNQMGSLFYYYLLGRK